MPPLKDANDKEIGVVEGEVFMIRGFLSVQI